MCAKTPTDEVSLEVWVGVCEVILYMMNLRTNLSCYFLSEIVFFIIIIFVSVFSIDFVNPCRVK